MKESSLSMIIVLLFWILLEVSEQPFSKAFFALFAALWAILTLCDVYRESKK